MAQAVSIRTFTAGARVRSQLSAREICGGESGTGTVFSPSTAVFNPSTAVFSPSTAVFSLSTAVFPCQYHPTNAPHSSSSTRCPYQKDRGTKSCNFP